MLQPSFDAYVGDGSAARLCEDEVRGDRDILGAEHLTIINQFALFSFREFGVLKISAGEPWFDQVDLDVFVRLFRAKCGRAGRDAGFGPHLNGRTRFARKCRRRTDEDNIAARFHALHRVLGG